MISAVVSGRLGRDAELKTLPSGDSVLEMSIGSDAYNFKTKEKDTTWVRASMFGTRGANLAQHLTKGTAVVVRGALTVRPYEKKDGSAGYSVDLRVDDIDMIGGNRRDGDGASAQRPKPKREPKEDAVSDFNDGSDDIPF